MIKNLKNFHLFNIFNREDIVLYINFKAFNDCLFKIFKNKTYNYNRRISNLIVFILKFNKDQEELVL